MIGKVSARGISVRFGRVQALDFVNVELRSGSATLLIGPNGAGKSTLMKIFLGLVRPDHGAFEVDDRRTQINNQWKRKLGYLPEAIAFSESLTGAQVLRFFAQARGVDRREVPTALARVGLEEAAKRRVRTYSRGMRQRLGLAVAILATPDLLILDEPTGGLDQEGLSVLWSVLSEWREAGRMVLIASHDLALMESRVDDICILRDGRVLAQGSSDELRRAAQLPHRVCFDVNPAETKRTALLCEAMEKWGKGKVVRQDDRLVVEVEPDSLLELMKIQSGFVGTIRYLRVEEPTLDLVYDKLLGAA